MGSLGDGCDDAVAASLLASSGPNSSTRSTGGRTTTAAAMFDYADIFHDRTRRHSYLGHLSGRIRKEVPFQAEPRQDERCPRQVGLARALAGSNDVPRSTVLLMTKVEKRPIETASERVRNKGIRPRQDARETHPGATGRC